MKKLAFVALAAVVATLAVVLTLSVLAAGSDTTDRCHAYVSCLPERRAKCEKIARDDGVKPPRGAAMTTCMMQVSLP